MTTQFVKVKDGGGTDDKVRSEFDSCRHTLAEAKGQLDIYKKAEALLQGEQRLTEKIAGDHPLHEIFEEACGLVERALQGSLAVILLLDGNRLRRGAAPSLPEYIAEVDGFEIDANTGTCSAAAALKERVITEDITKDPHWARHLDLAAKHRLRSGWATPILSSTDSVLGTFALYWPAPCNPSSQQLQIIDQLVRLLAFAIERKEAAEALKASEKLARGQAEALTLTLDALAKETDPSRAMEHVLRTVTSLFGAHSCSVWLRDQVSGLMVFEFALEDGVFKTKDEAKLMAISPSLAVEAIPVWAEMFRIKRPLVLEDIQIKPDFPWRAHLLALGVITMLAVPMVVAGQGEGLIGIRFTRKREFSAQEQELAQVLANQAMLAIQMARLSGQSRQSIIVEERNRFAREIHDTLAQGLTGVIAQLEAARGAISQKKTVRILDHLERAGELAREGLREARRSVQALRPSALEEKPLAVALRDLIDRMTTGMTMKANLTLQGDARQLPPEWETNLLRIGQEVLTNAIRHANASQFDVVLTFGSDEVFVNFCDNGRGFDSSNENGGFGIQGMRERVHGIGGKFLVQSAAGKGTTISVVLPWNTVRKQEVS
jgi:signal transduction histidine kinase